MLILLGALAFVVLGAWFLSLDAQTIEGQRRFSSPVLVYGIGGVAIVFFGACAIFAFKKLFDTSPGLILNRQGLTDNSSAIPAGFVPWSEVSRIEKYQVGKQKFISVIVDSPEKYMGAGNVLQRKARQANLKMCGTPISISSNALKIKFDALHEMIEGYLRHYRETENQSARTQRSQP